MCGFAAIVSPGRRLSPHLAKALDGDLYHRGPDSSGSFVQDGCALVFRRLAIMDPDPRSDQPFSDESGQVHLVFNGEIYNQADLRRRLSEAGVMFRTTSDTEVVLRGWIEWGEELFGRLEGMYALAIVDQRSRRLVAARDPLGIKPLYLLCDDGFVALASEMRPLHRFRKAEVDPDAVPELMTFGWAAGGNSNFKGIERVAGGTLVSVSLGDATVSRKRFLDPLDLLENGSSASQEESAAIVRDAVRSSIESHLMSDVGYTVQLSGGVDSSLIAAVTAGLSGNRLKTFGVALPDDQAFDESDWRRSVVDRYAIDHEELLLGNAEYADALPTAIRHMEGPVPHGADPMLMMLCQRSREESRVILTGEGADEFFGGYERYATWPSVQRKELLSRFFPKWCLPDCPPFRGVRRLSGRDAAAYASVYQDLEHLALLFPELVPAPGAREKVSARFDDLLTRIYAVDQFAYLESLLVRQDKMSMAASVEARVPFVHLPLAKVVNALPRRVLSPGGETKPLLKQMAETYLPHDLVHRRKNGFRIDYDVWMRDERHLGRYLDGLVDSGSRLAGFVDSGRLRDAVGGFRNGIPSNLRLFKLMNLEMWLRSVDEAPAPADEPFIAS